MEAIRFKTDSTKQLGRLMLKGIILPATKRLQVEMISEGGRWQ